MSMGTVLKNLRKEFGYTQADVSKLLRISPETLIQWEEDSRLPEEANLLTISKLYHIDSQLLRQSNSASPKETLFQKAFGAVNHLFSSQFSKSPSLPLTDGDLRNVLQKKGLIIVPTLASSSQEEPSLLLLETNLITRYYDNINWLRVDALTARKILSKETIDLVVFTPITAIFIEQIEHVAKPSMALITLSAKLYEQLTTTHSHKEIPPNLTP